MLGDREQRAQQLAGSAVIIIENLISDATQTQNVFIPNRVPDNIHEVGERFMATVQLLSSVRRADRRESALRERTPGEPLDHSGVAKGGGGA